MTEKESVIVREGIDTSIINLQLTTDLMGTVGTKVTADILTAVAVSILDMAEALVPKMEGSDGISIAE